MKKTHISDASSLSDAQIELYCQSVGMLLNKLSAKPRSGSAERAEEPQHQWFCKTYREDFIDY